jgi:hypothetical protein
VPVPKKRLTLSRFFLGLAGVLVVLTLLQVVLWPLLAFSAGPTMALALVLVLDLLWPVLAFWRLPHAADMPWRGLRLYVPDVSSWLIGIGILTVMLNILILLKWLL